MAESRIIPCLLLAKGRLVKTIGYEMPTYVGDPVNIVNIFSELEADEIIVLDIMAGRHSGAVDHAAVAALCEETSVPFGYGGGIRTLEDIRSILAAGAEKIVLCTAAAEQPELVDRAASLAGSQAVVVSIDVRRERDGSLRPYVRNATARVDRDVIDFAKEMERRGAGEILLNAVDRDGRMEGFDLDLIRRVTDAVQIPVIAGCGAGRRADLREAVQAGASAAAAGSIFVFQGRNRSVVVNYPSRQQARALMS